MPTSSYLRGRQSAKHSEGSRVRKPSEKKRASSNTTCPKPQINSIPDIDMLVHLDSMVTVCEAMGPTFKGTFTQYDALNGKEEKQFLLVRQVN